MISATHQAKHYTGTIQLGGRPLPVDVTYGTFTSQENIHIGADTFQLNSQSRTGFEGHRVVKENERPLVDENVTVNMDLDTIAFVAEDPKAAAKMMGLDNLEEFQFAPGDNALIMRADNISMKMVGNCTKLTKSE